MARLRGVLSVATVALTCGAAIILGSSPVSAASSTDTVFVFNYPTLSTAPLPAGTPDGATPLVSTLSSACQAVASTGLPEEVVTLSDGEVLGCIEPFFKPTGLFVAGTPNVGIWLPYRNVGGPPCGVAVYVFPVSGGNTDQAGISEPGMLC
jgi:hypothetical protein